MPAILPPTRTVFFVLNRLFAFHFRLASGLRIERADNVSAVISWKAGKAAHTFDNLVFSAVFAFTGKSDRRSGLWPAERYRIAEAMISSRYPGSQARRRQRPLIAEHAF
jgi:hypothetical protein